MRYKILFILISQLFLASCANFLFYPVKEQYYSRENLQKFLDIKIEDVYFKSRDGTRLHGWFMPNRVGKLKGTVLFCHGNAENISSHIRMVWWMARNGYNVFMPDYRGYGLSEGEPDLVGVHEDVQAAIELVLSRADIRHKNLVMYGHSLGGAVAISSLADSPNRSKFRALIVEGSFTSYRVAAREALGSFWLTWLFQYPLSWTIPDDIRPVDAIPRISPIPVLIIHGDEDPVIDASHGKGLFDAAKQPKEYWVVKGGRHASFNTPEHQAVLLKYLDKILK